LQAEKRVTAQIEQDLQRTEAEVQQGQSKMTALQEQEDEAKRLLAECAERSHESEVKQRETLQQTLREREERRKEGRRQLAEMATKVNQARSALDAVRNAASQGSLATRRVELERQTLLERMTNEYGEEHVAGLVAGLAENQQQLQQISVDERKELRERLARLKARIIREGEVDPSSIQQYEDEKTRLDGLLAQKEDLATGADVLQQTLVNLIENAEKRFVETFDAIRQSFCQLIPRLFGGGEGELTLTEPEKPMQGGVEITVRPPGKKPKSIDLLSGGEKALCATAMIMAMFQHRPSPLCILDEVDAPLDEANLLRFLEVIKEMGASTQFIMITHNKQSMAMADKLVGVTMEQPGASKMISVTLEEAVEQVA
jgi:chromosome segregation protein